MKIDENILTIIRDVPWFANCGKDTEILLNFKYEFINKSDMLKSISDVQWDNIENEEFNILYDWFRTSSICLDWDRTVKSIRKENMPEFDKLVLEKINKIFGKNSKLVIDSFHYDLLMIIMKLTIEKHFSSEHEPMFFNDILKIYQAGHIPCGWCGDYPEGEILIY